jgi:hypothetical protein
MTRLPAVLVFVFGSEVFAGNSAYNVVALDAERQVIIQANMDTGAQTVTPIDVPGLTTRLETVAVRNESVFLVDPSGVPAPFGPHLVEFDAGTGRWTKTALSPTLSEPYDLDVKPDGNLVVAHFSLDEPVLSTIYVATGWVGSGAGILDRIDDTWVGVDSTGAIITRAFEQGNGTIFYRKQTATALPERIDVNVRLGDSVVESDDTLIAAGRGDGKLHRVNIDTGLSQVVYEYQGDPIARLGIDPEGRLVASRSTANFTVPSGLLTRIDLAAGTEQSITLKDGYRVSDFDILIVESVLQPGDADQDIDFDQFDLIQVQQRAKYLSGNPATWGEGDWNGAPGGSVGNPPGGDGFFNQLDIVVAQQAGLYLSGPYAAITKGGRLGDGQTSINYNPANGELGVDAPANVELTSINIDSAAGIFSGAPSQNLGGSFDNDTDTNIFKATFGSSFGSLSFGNVAQAGLSEAFVLGDLTVVGSLRGGGGLGDVDLIYVAEPSTSMLLGLGVLALLPCHVRVAKAG